MCAFPTLPIISLHCTCDDLMWIAVSANILMAGSLCAFALSLIIFMRHAQLMRSTQSKENGILRKLLSLAKLFALFFALCGLSHLLNAIRAFHPQSVVIRDFQIVVLVVCALVSLLTVCVCYTSFPAILSKVLPKSESNVDENGKHANHYMLETVDVVKDSIVVLSGDLKVVRENAASKELFGSPSLIGKPFLQYVHPADIRRFEAFAQSALATYTVAPTKIEYRIKPAARITSAFFGKSRKSGKVHSEKVVENSSTHQSNSFSMQSTTSSLAAESGTIKPEFVHVESTIFKHMYFDKDDVLQISLEMVTCVKNQSHNSPDAIRKETEEQGRINSAKLRYLSCIAHDLKTPLQSFCYTLDLLLQTALTKEQRGFVDQTMVAVDLMKLTISQTMDISKALTGAKLTPRRATVLLSDVLSRVEIIIGGFGKQVPVNFEIAPTIVDEIITDEEWLWQMLLNLLTNACKYTDTGCITVRVSLTARPQSPAPPQTSAKSVSRSFTLRNLTAHTNATANLLMIEVIDTGVGVSSDKLPYMFDAFSQVQEGQVTGTGLGLFGVRMRAEGLQGICGARHNTESSTGTGTVMWFAIPYLANRSRSNSEASHRSNMSTTEVREAALTDVMSPDELARRAQEVLQRSPLTAMVVEDTLTVRKLMERMLLQMGFAKVVGYDNGSKGLDAMIAESMDIVFSDVQMPIMTGPEMASRFRKFEAEALAAGARSKRQVIVAVTANGSELRDNSNVGFDDVYPKPLSRSDIYKIINEFL